MDPRNPFRCFDVRFLAASLGIGLGVVGLAMVGKGFPRGGAVRIALAVGEGLLIGVLLLLMVRAVRRLDEMHRRMHVEAAAISFVATAFVATLLGFVEKAAGWHLPWGLAAWPAMTVVWAIGVNVLRRRYGT